MDGSGFSEMFPVTSPRGEDHAGLYDCSDQCMVSSHLPARGGSNLIDAMYKRKMFPVTSPRGEDPTSWRSSSTWTRFPVTSPRGEDLGTSQPRRPQDVSSHLPARGGSQGQRFLKPAHGVSSHLPARGGSTRGCSLLLMVNCFQSPPREGRITTEAVREARATRFPVTSPRGEDLALTDLRRWRQSFPVTSPRGEDPGIIAISRTWTTRFQSPPREGRIRFAKSFADMLMRFPVTSPRGEDRCQLPDGTQVLDVSSHLPARGGSTPASQMEKSRGVSSHLPARGGSAGFGRQPGPRLVSSHLPARGGSSRSVMYWMASFSFPVTSPRGEDRPHEIASILRDDSFQSPPREGRILPVVDCGCRRQQFPVTSPRGEDPARPGRPRRSGAFPVTSPRGEDRHWRVYHAHGPGFQSPPREGRITVSVAGRDTGFGRFQSPPREGRIPDAVQVRRTLVVSSHLPARGGSNELHRTTPGLAGFQSPPREGRILLTVWRHGIGTWVSSHLPARGGSFCSSVRSFDIKFPVTSPRGEDPYCAFLGLSRWQFPVTSPRGEDRPVRQLYVRRYLVSSHLPARGGSGLL